MRPQYFGRLSASKRSLQRGRLGGEAADVQVGIPPRVGAWGSRRRRRQAPTALPPGWLSGPYESWLLVNKTPGRGARGSVWGVGGPRATEIWFKHGLWVVIFPQFGVPYLNPGVRGRSQFEGSERPSTEGHTWTGWVEKGNGQAPLKPSGGPGWLFALTPHGRLLSATVRSSPCRPCPDGDDQPTWGGSRGRCRRYFAEQHAIGGVAICRVDEVHTDWRLPGSFARAHDSMLLLHMHQRPLSGEQPQPRRLRHAGRCACRPRSRVINRQANAAVVQGWDLQYGRDHEWVSWPAASLGRDQRGKRQQFDRT